MNKKFELLAPAGSLEICKAVIEAGADAVYVGGEQFGARAYANNFSKEELLEALDFAHLRGKKIYLTVNTLFKNTEIDKLYEYLLPFYERGLDAVIVQDIGALVCIHKWFPNIEIHTSTQMTITGVEGVRLLQELGVSRVVMAREMSIAEMKTIHDKTGMELEAFVHGALCYSYSGQCLFSSMLGGRSGNRGRCAQPCRLPYSTKKNETYVLSLKDFCGIEKLPQLLDASVYSLKIEGRMKQLSYAVGVVSYYRKYIDMCLSNSSRYKVSQEDKQALISVGSRCGFTDAYFDRHNGSDMVTFEKPSFQQSMEIQTPFPKYLPMIGQLTLHLDVPSKLQIRYGDVEVVSHGNVPQKAMKQPLLKNDLEKRLNKTKDTAFFFEQLNIDMDDNLFLPNGVINQLRRDAIVSLEQALLKKYLRTVDTKNDIVLETKFQPAAQETVVSIEEREFLDVVIGQKFVSTIYLDSNLYTKNTLFQELKKDISLCHANQKKAFFILPYIFRVTTALFYKEHLTELKNSGVDGIVVKTYEELWFAKEYLNELDIVTDHNLYTYNDIASFTLLKLGATRNTIPIELNKKEIFRRTAANSEMIVYGHYPLMTSAQCVQKNMKGCNQTPGMLYLKDRYKKSFPVKNYCSDCYNVIYNSLPTMLFQYLEELKQSGIRTFRLHFSVESKQQVENVCKLFEGFYIGNQIHFSQSWKDEYTNGHYKRGVE